MSAVTDLLEDPDGAPYPEQVQLFVRGLMLYLPRDVIEMALENLVDALESVKGDVDD